MDEVLGVRGLVVARRERIRNEDRRPAGRGDLPHGRAGAAEHEIDGREGCAEALGFGNDAVVVTDDTRPDERRSRARP